jgi:hypothetical protein
MLPVWQHFAAALAPADKARFGEPAAAYSTSYFVVLNKIFQKN